MPRIHVVALAIALLGASPAAGLAQSSPTSATLAWTSPGDDSLTGTAAQYDVRMSTTPLDGASFGAATRLAGAPAPLVAGSQQTMLVNGLSPSTQYWFAIKTADASGNWSGISNIATFTTPASNDSIRPAAPVLVLAGSTATSVSLGWNATGDDSLSGTATRYDVRWSTATITAANFASATQVTTGVPEPGAPGTAQSATVGGLDRSVDLYFAVRVADEVNNWSALSNVVLAAHLLDTSPPATPSGVTVATDPGGVRVHWTANSEPDLAGYHVYRAVAAAGPFTRIDATTVPTNDYLDATPPDSAALWYQVTAVDNAANESAHSAAVRVWLVGGNITAWKLEPVYPNPSGQGSPVTMPLDVPTSGPFSARVDILNSAGERVRTIELQGLIPGVTNIVWDGRNDAGRATAPGVYRAWLQAGSDRQLIRLVRTP